MSRIKLAVAVALAVLGVLAATSTASAAPIACTTSASGVNCSGTLTGLPPGILTHVVLTADYVCVFAFHPEVVAAHGGGSAGTSDDIVTDAHGNLTYNLTVATPTTCPAGTVPKFTSATLTASQGGVVLLTLGPIPL